jgi:hypothetical protein
MPMRTGPVRPSDVPAALHVSVPDNDADDLPLR